VSFHGRLFFALAMERWNLHRRIALLVIRALGESPERIILGFMASTAALSMWISNTATAMMMTPIGLAVIYQTSEMLEHGSDIREAVRTGKFQFGAALMLGIAYAASIGGIATIIGTPPNAVFAAILEEMYGVEIGFARWMLYGVPLALLFLLLTWLYLTRIAFRFEFERRIL
ncbi:MAG TPA: SLC13 family permease, partial [Flexilinea sp.]|nr:SLC13 family permease [Flexilinea sp.]